MYNYNVVLKCLNLFKQQKSCRGIEEELGIAKSTAHLWILTYYDNYIELEKRYVKQHKNKKDEYLKSIDKNIYEYLEKLVNDNPFLSHNNFIFKLNQEFNLKLNSRKLKYILDNINITKKRVRRRIIESRDFLDLIISKREKFLEIIKKELNENIICIDETGFNSFLNKNTKGYSKKGIEINIPVSENKINNQSLLMALSIDKIVHYDITDKHVNSTIYFDFIKDLILKLKENKNKSYILIFDNVRFHHNIETIKLITDAGYKYYFLPPYSPNINPIENVNSIIKDIYFKEIITDNNYFGNNGVINKENNKNITINENENKKHNIENNKINIIKKYLPEIEALHLNKILSKNEIKIKKKEISVKKKSDIKEMIKKEILNTKKRIKDRKINNLTIIKKYIVKSIEIFNKDYNEENIKKIYKRAFTFNYKNIEAELKDRLKILN